MKTNGWIITVGVFAPILLILSCFEFAIYIIQAKNTIFKKPTRIEYGIFLEIFIGIISIAVAGVLTSLNDGTILGYIIEWWITVAIIFWLIIARLFITDQFIRKYRYSPSMILEWSMDDLCKVLQIKDYNKIIDHCGIKNGNWLKIINDDYHYLHQRILSETNKIKNNSDYMSSLLADIVLFQEKNVISMFKKKRNYVNALFLDLIINLKKLVK